MNYLSVNTIEPSVFKGSPSTSVYFAGGGLPGDQFLLKDIVNETLSYDTPYVVLTGYEPMRQNMLALIGLCYMLKRRYYKKVILKTTGTKFNQLLFINVKHFVLHPSPENFDPVKFARYVKYSSFKTLDKARTPDLTLSTKSPRWNYAKFVEVDFYINKPGDMKFASLVFNDYGVRRAEIRTTIRRGAEYPLRDFGKDWKEYEKSFLPYNFHYVVE